MEFSYPVHFTRNLFKCDNPLFHNVVAGAGDDSPKRILFVLDQGLVQHHPSLPQALFAYCKSYPVMEPAARPLIFCGGEPVKNNPAHVRKVRQAIHQAGLCRHSYVVAVGGGALIDMAGYAAVTAHRGVRLIRVPTTVLGQNDAAVGVKNGINAFGKKNFLGTFAVPWAVLNDSTFLRTLSDRDWISGLAEAVKVALIKDGGFFEFIETHARALRNRDMALMEKVIHTCARLHLNHIACSGDPFECGSSRPLDFGHWAAHKLEQLSAYTLRHGEAVAIGIAIDVGYACLKGMITEAARQRVIQTLTALGFSLNPVWLENETVLAAGLREFQEHLGGRLTVMLLAGIGQGMEVHAMDLAVIKAAVNQLRIEEPAHKEVRSA